MHSRAWGLFFAADVFRSCPGCLACLGWQRLDKSDQPAAGGREALEGGDGAHARARLDAPRLASEGQQKGSEGKAMQRAWGRWRAFSL